MPCDYYAPGRGAEMFASPPLASIAPRPSRGLICTAFFKRRVLADHWARMVGLSGRLRFKYVRYERHC
jgi:hypothetical protein